MTTARHHRSGTGRRGFSLAELVLALGVLAIGMTMAAALFPAAIKLNEQSTRDSVGTIVATNGLAMARAVIHPGTGPGQFNPNNHELRLVEDTECQAFSDPNFLKYRPDPSAPTTRGVLVLGRPLAHGWQLVVVSYDMTTTDNQVVARSVSIDDISEVDGSPTVDISGGGVDPNRCIGALLVCAPADPNDSRIAYARMTYDPESRKLFLDHAIDDEAKTWTALVIVEDGGAGQMIAKSPVMAVLVAETTLH